MKLKSRVKKTTAKKKRLSQVYLVPGFFGFTAIGGLNYFHRVEEVLTQFLKERGVDTEVIEVETQPTGSIRRRAIRLMDTVIACGGERAAGLHFVGHSTGGLDIRLLLTPGVQLVPSDDERRIADKTLSVTTLSTPHFGTPLANLFTNINGRNLLYILTLLITSKPGRITSHFLARLISTVAHLDDYLGQKNTILDSIAERLLRQIHHRRDHKFWDFFRQISRDQGALVQLTPEAVDLFNAAVPNSRGIFYTSFVTAAPPPRLALNYLSGRNFYARLTRALFSLCHLVAQRVHEHYPYPSPARRVADQIQKNLPFKLSQGTNDGIVPTLSQVWTRVGGVIMADHLDVVGQYPHTVKGKFYPGWLNSGAGFSDADFQKLWGSVADVIAKRK